MHFVPSTDLHPWRLMDRDRELTPGCLGMSAFVDGEVDCVATFRRPTEVRKSAFGRHDKIKAYLFPFPSGWVYLTLLSPGEDSIQGSPLFRLANRFIPNHTLIF